VRTFVLETNGVTVDQRFHLLHATVYYLRNLVGAATRRGIGYTGYNTMGLGFTPSHAL
jgi:hypothetical protein